jgi:hypothetical protein
MCCRLSNAPALVTAHGIVDFFVGCSAPARQANGALRIECVPIRNIYASFIGVYYPQFLLVLRQPFIGAHAVAFSSPVIATGMCFAPARFR